jgi:hypothetical protein
LGFIHWACSIAPPPSNATALVVTYTAGCEAYKCTACVVARNLDLIKAFVLNE